MQPQETQVPLPPLGRTPAPLAAKPLGQALPLAAHQHRPQYTQSSPPLLGPLQANTLQAIGMPCVVTVPFQPCFVFASRLFETGALTASDCPWFS